MFGDARRFEAVATEDPVNFGPLQDPRGRTWLRDLPASAGDLCRRWRLLPSPGDFRTGYHGVVVPVRRDDRSYVLKLTWRTPWEEPFRRGFNHAARPDLSTRRERSEDAIQRLGDRP